MRRIAGAGLQAGRHDEACTTLERLAELQRRQLRRPRAVEDGAERPARSRARRRRAPAAAAGRRGSCRRGRRSRSETAAARRRSAEHVDVLRRRDAAEQHDVAVRPDLRQRARARSARAAGDSARCPGRRRRARTRARPRASRSVSGLRSPAFGVMTCTPPPTMAFAGSGGCGEPPRVGQLAAEVQAADEANKSPSGAPSARAQRRGQRELRPRRQRLLRARAAAVGGREEEDAAHGCGPPDALTQPLTSAPAEQSLNQSSTSRRAARAQRRAIASRMAATNSQSPADAGPQLVRRAARAARSSSCSISRTRRRRRRRTERRRRRDRSRRSPASGAARRAAPACGGPAGRSRPTSAR